jgi:XTP/dITP diphosphohydrolase
MKLLFASHNLNKTQEIQSFLDDEWELLNLHDLKLTDPIPETGETLEENALLKARNLFDKFDKPCFADDSGLEVLALNGEPGVRSARYAGESKNDHANMDLLLSKLIDHSDRSAHFKTVIAYIDQNSEEHLFTGLVKGTILTKKVGSQGFGYDPIFQPEGYTESFAQMGLEQKNKISHRTRAVNQLIQFLTKSYVRQ